MAKKKSTKAASDLTGFQSPHDFIDASVSVEHIRREVQMMEARYAIDLNALSHAELKFVQEEVGRKLVAQLRAKIAAKKFDVKTVRFPEDWKQGAKIAFISWCFIARYKLPFGKRVAALGSWISKKWPPRFTEVTMEANAYHPSIAIPDHETCVEIMCMVRREAYR